MGGQKKKWGTDNTIPKSGKKSDLPVFITIENHKIFLNISMQQLKRKDA